MDHARPQYRKFRNFSQLRRHAIMQWKVESTNHVTREIKVIRSECDRADALLAYTREYLNATRTGRMGNLATDSFETTVNGQRMTVRLLPVVEVR
jgi:hypothetical protein